MSGERVIGGMVLELDPLENAIHRLIGGLGGDVTMNGNTFIWCIVAAVSVVMVIVVKKKDILPFGFYVPYVALVLFIGAVLLNPWEVFR